MRWLNLGIVAHVDAGKTTLTERLLYAAGVIDEVGSVDDGTTRTDSLALERQRGITIRSAVASFAVRDVAVNLIDTPGHPDFVAEVERALGVLDGAVLVISAVEGVQPQTRILLRSLRRLAVPTLLFVNKIDRRGAGYRRVLKGISRWLRVEPAPMGEVRGLGTPPARFRPWGADAFRDALTEVLVSSDDRLLAAYLDDEAQLTAGRLRPELAAQVRRCQAYPVFFGSAITGAGVPELMDGLAELLPAAAGDAGAPVSGRAFKIDRGSAGEKVAWVRLFAGTVRTRDRLRYGPGRDGKVTSVTAFDPDPAAGRDRAVAGQIAKLRGLGGARIGDPVGTVPERFERPPQFDRPTLETVVVPRDPTQGAALRVALDQLAEQDPLIDVRQDGARHEISVSLYGEVQREVIAATLASDYGLEVEFRAVTTLCIERVTGCGEAVEVLNTAGNPFHATLALRVEPAPVGSGVALRSLVAPTETLYLYKNADGFVDALGQHVRRTLREGLSGWPVPDCAVTLLECAYSLADGPPARRGPMPTSADFRNLTPIVLMRALQRAGTVVCEPMVRAGLEVPAGSVGAVLGLLGRLGAATQDQTLTAELATIHARLPAARLPRLRRSLPGTTGGEGVLASSLAGYRPVPGPPPVRARTRPSPLNRQQYLMALARVRA